ncbi:MAG: flagellar biosynthetic protein FliO [Gammaproteobacteria bacterium]|nr:MAG: flagellar biosynthetic protein FliO [Gammaproteobacteria bacterium]
MRRSLRQLQAWLGLAVALGWPLAGLAQGSDGVAPATDLWGPALRMLLSLAAVLALLGGCAWLARRLRERGSLGGGLIEVVGGISLGGRDKVVLLQVGDEQVLVGISQAGMRPLHVLRRKRRPEPKEFDDYLEATQSLEVPQ